QARCTLTVKVLNCEVQRLDLMRPKLALRSTVQRSKHTTEPSAHVAGNLRISPRGANFRKHVTLALRDPGPAATRREHGVTLVKSGPSLLWLPILAVLMALIVVVQALQARGSGATQGVNTWNPKSRWPHVRRWPHQGTLAQEK